MDWDRQGRLWAVEMPGFVPNLEAPEPYMEPIGKVVVLEDTDTGRRDGQAHRLCRRPGARALAQGARSRRPGRRTAERLADARHQRRPQDGHQGVDHRPVRPPRGAGRAERQRLLLGDGQLDAHRQRGHVSAAEERQVRSPQDADARRVGRHPGRRRPDLPEHQRIVGARRLRADAVFPAQPGAGADPRQLRGAARRGQRGQRGLAGAAQPRHQPRLSVRHRSAGRHARTASPRSARLRSTAATGCRPRSTATCSSPSPPPTWSAGS